MARLREGRANTARGAAHFLRETVGRVRYAGARGQLTVRADSGFYTHAIVAACRRMDVRFSITVRQSASLRSLIDVRRVEHAVVVRVDAEDWEWQAPADRWLPTLPPPGIVPWPGAGRFRRGQDRTLTGSYAKGKGAG